MENLTFTKSSSFAGQSVNIVVNLRKILRGPDAGKYEVYTDTHYAPVSESEFFENPLALEQAIEKLNELGFSK